MKLGRFIEVCIANWFPANKMIMQGNIDTMKIRAGHNKQAGRDTFWVQLTDKKTLRSMRIFLEPHEFEYFTNYMAKLHRLEN